MTRVPVRAQESTRLRLSVLAVGVVGIAALLLVGLVRPVAAEPGWEPGKPPLATPWTDQVGPGNALPEYPRPQLRRAQWRTLNGLWDYGPGNESGTPDGSTLDERILVPYPPESALSGVQRHDDVMVYRKRFTVPKAWQGKRLLVHFGAVDQEAEVFLNGVRVATHGGGYTAFSADVTKALRPGEQELVVRAVDRNDDADYAVGKQRNDPEGILYTGASGIWQSVWMEPVPKSHVDSVDIASDVPGGSFLVTTNANAPDGTRVAVVAKAPNGAVAGSASGVAGKPVRVKLRDPQLWSPENPNLYNFDVRLLGKGKRTVDTVGSYAGLRSISLVKDDKGRARMALNGKIYFQQGPLDQGYWPDGIYTAPTDEALRFDLEQTKRLGFNMVRKHVKVEPARWYYWADKLGLLVWQDMPSLPIDLDDPPGTQPAPTEQGKRNFRAELHDMIDQFRSVTSIIGWVPFNEGWGEFDTKQVADETKAADPTRLVNASSGVNCCYSLPDTGAGDIYDDHTYVGPGHPVADGKRAAMNGEYGGLGLVSEGHLWPGEPQAYEMTETRQQLNTRFAQVADLMVTAVRKGGMSGGVYTQTTDVENEVNGLFTYDRKVLKLDPGVVRRKNLAVIAAGSG